MNKRTSLLAGAGFFVLMGAGLTAPVDAKLASRANAGAQSSDMKAEIDELKAEVAALTARLNAQETAQHAAVTQAQLAAAAAQEQAQSAKAQVTAASAGLPGEIKTVLAAQPAPKPGWWNSTTLSGRMYFNASHIDQKSDGQAVGRSTAFDIKRLYLGVDHKFDDTFSANVTTDVSLIANTNTVTGTANSEGVQPGQGTTAPAAFPKTVGETLYLKKAYLQAKLDPALTLRVGSADLPWIPFVEDVYGFRYVEQTLTDRTGFATSADWGVHALGTIADGHISYAVAAIDGAGYRNPLRSKSIDLEGRISANYKGLVAAVGGYTGKRGADTFTPYSPTNNAVTPVQTGTNVATLHTAQRFNALLAYTNGALRLGGEYFYAKNWNQVTKASSDTSDGYSLFTSYGVTPLISVFGRYDWLKPTKKLFPDITDRYLNLGISYQPVKIVELALVYKRDQVNDGFFSPGNNNPANFAFPIGGRSSGTVDEIGLYGQFRF